MNFDNKKLYIAWFDYYQNLLTKKQISYFSLHFLEDYSLTEIAEIKKVTKNAVYDSISKIIKTMQHFEDILKLNSKQLQREKLYKKYSNKLVDQNFFDELRAIDDL